MRGQAGSLETSKRRYGEEVLDMEHKKSEAHLVRVHFSNGDSFVTPINGTIEDIEQYYLNKWFNTGSVNDNIQCCVKVEFLKEAESMELL